MEITDAMIVAAVEADERYMDEHWPEGDGEERVIEILKAALGAKEAE